MTYSVKEIFYTLQGEGAQAGTPAVFLRFTGCNLWSGLEQDRHQAICQFCDTDFVGTDGINGGKFKHAQELAEAVALQWPNKNLAHRLVVCTGGEPLLQLDTVLIEALHKLGFKIAVETNGTIAAPAGLDWICVSPKSDAPLNQNTGDELKLVFPQNKAKPELFEGLAFKHFLLQPMDGPKQTEHMQQAAQYCLQYPQWRLSLQTHKIIGIA
jgi:7-carboxy-7-deazaguanine synthase (Cx14CxxC type)